MNIVIIEDETFATQRLEKMITGVNAIHKVVARLESVHDSIEWFKTNPEPDLIFLDIHLEDDLSFTIFKSVTITSPVVFTTATDELATKSFELLEIDYLHKPIVLQELSGVIEKYSKPLNIERKPVKPDIFDDIIHRNI